MINEAGQFEIVYRYKWRSMPFFWLPFIVMLTAVLAMVASRRTGWQDGLIILAIGIAFALLATWLLFHSLADVCISNRGITRRVQRWTWQSLQWADVAHLTITRSTNLETGRKVRSFALRGSKDAPVFSRLIIFQERPGEMNELLAQLQACVAKHRISVREL